MPENASKYFTRHLLRSGMQCPTKLYYKNSHYPEDERIKPFLEHAGFNKYQLKKLLSRLYPNAALVNETSRKAAFEQTAELVQKEQASILDAAFIAEQCFAKVALLNKSGNEIELYDVQTRAFNPHKHRLVNHHGTLYGKWRPYIADLAFKVFICRQLNPEWNFSTYLLMPEKSHKAKHDQLLAQLQNPDADLEGEELFCRVDVSAHVHEFMDDADNEGQPFEELVEILKNQFFAGEWNPPNIGKKCRSCEFRIAPSQVDKGAASGFNKCWLESGAVPEFSADESTVLDLIGPGINTWMENGVYLQKDIAIEDLPPLKSITRNKNAITQKQRQTLQVSQAKGLEIPNEIIKQPVFDEIARWEYPLYFLDFEAGNYAVPVRQNRKPYHLVIFQFSCHTLRDDGTLVHHQWIDDARCGYPNYALVRQLMQVPEINAGTIIQYSNFEHYALKTIRKELDREYEDIDDAGQLISWLDGIIRRPDSNNKKGPYLADMSRLVKNFYYNRHMENSLSIKDVLRSVLSVSDFLKEKYSRPYRSINFDEIIWWQREENQPMVKSPYKILQEMQGEARVGRGTEAMVIYGKMLAGLLTEAYKKAAVQALLKYCELDTLAMLMIFEHWKFAGKQ